MTLYCPGELKVGAAKEPSLQRVAEKWNSLPREAKEAKEAREARTIRKFKNKIQ